MATSSPIKIATAVAAAAIYIHINLDFGRNTEVLVSHWLETDTTTAQQEHSKCVRTYGTEQNQTK